MMICIFDKNSLLSACMSVQCVWLIIKVVDIIQQWPALTLYVFDYKRHTVQCVCLMIKVVDIIQQWPAYPSPPRASDRLRYDASFIWKGLPDCRISSNRLLSLISVFNHMKETSWAWQYQSFIQTNIKVVSRLYSFSWFLATDEKARNSAQNED